MVVQQRPYFAETKADWDTHKVILAYEYNTHVYRCAKLTSISLVLSRPLPRLFMINKTRLPMDFDNIYSAFPYRIRLIRRAAKPNILLQRKLKTAQKQHQVDHDKKLRFEPKCAPRNYVFVKQPPLKSSAAQIFSRWASRNQLQL